MYSITAVQVVVMATRLCSRKKNLKIKKKNCKCNFAFFIAKVLFQLQFNNHWQYFNFLDFVLPSRGTLEQKKSKIGSTNEAGDIVKHSVQKKEVVMAHNTSHDIFTSLLLSSAWMID
jgi:hypothetical protein